MCGTAINKTHLSFIQQLSKFWSVLQVDRCQELNLITHEQTSQAFHFYCPRETESTWLPGHRVPMSTNEYQWNVYKTWKSHLLYNVELYNVINHHREWIFTFTIWLMRPSTKCGCTKQTKVIWWWDTYCESELITSGIDATTAYTILAEYPNTCLKNYRATKGGKKQT